MRSDPTFKPQLRPIEAFRVPTGDGGGIAVRDRSGLSDTVLTMSEATLGILTLMDGDRTVEQIRDQYLLLHGQSISNGDLQTVLEHLERAHLLEGEVFEALYRARMDEYRRRGTRAMLDPDSLGIGDGDGDLFDAMLAETPPVSLDQPVVGLIAPHLDYPRGRPGYARAYATLRDRAVPKRVVILGTNHMGRATSVVATGSNFATPLGTTPTDLSFLERLEDRCGDLRARELDHAREHSVELQVAWLQHLFGPTAFEMLAVLCPDPCGPTGTAPYDGEGVDLRDFAQALREVMVEDGADTLLIAGADLSHVGAAFGDDPVLDDDFLGEVRIRDEKALQQLVRRDVEGFRCSVADDGNPTRVCSAGCIFTVATVLQDATPTLLGYHQAVDQPTQTCVTCAAIAYT